MRGRGAAATVMLLGTAMAAPASAALQDEIQVYLDELNAPREWGLDVHANATPVGTETPTYPGEIVSRHGLRATPEFSLGLGHDLEAGLYLPAVVDGAGHADLAGLKLRLKWLPWHGASHAGWFSGANLELSRVAARYEEARSGSELRVMLGRRTEDWTIGVNPVLDWAMSDSPRSARPDFNTGLKVARRIHAGIAAGVEYYADWGPLGRSTPGSGTDRRVYLALDVDRTPWVFNLGVGYGLTTASDQWTIKAIFTVPWAAGAAAQ